MFLSLDPKENGFDLVAYSSLNKIEKYLHVYAYVTNIETEGYAKAKLKRVLYIKSLEGPDLSQKNRELTYTATTNLEDLEEEEKKVIKWKVEYSKYVNDHPTNKIDEYTGKGETLTITMPENLSDSIIKITAYEEKENTKAIYYTTCQLKEIKEDPQDVDWEDKYNEDEK